MDIITKNIHLFIIIYALYGGYEYYEQQDGKLVGLKQTLEAGKAKVQREGKIQAWGSDCARLPGGVDAL